MNNSFQCWLWQITLAGWDLFHEKVRECIMMFKTLYDCVLKSSKTCIFQMTRNGVWFEDTCIGHFCRMKFHCITNSFEDWGFRKPNWLQRSWNFLRSEIALTSKVTEMKVVPREGTLIYYAGDSDGFEDDIDDACQLAGKGVLNSTDENLSQKDIYSGWLCCNIPALYYRRLLRVSFEGCVSLYP